MICVLSISIGYLLGTILPAYYIGRRKGFDIRHEGEHYAGTLNVYHVVGIKSAVVTALFDLTKGVIAIQIAMSLGAGFPCAQVSGLAAVFGHVLPVYLDFRGGQGVACATGILLYYLGHYLANGSLSMATLPFIALIIFIFAYVARHGEIISIVILPLLAYTVLIHNPGDPCNTFLVIVILYIMSVGVHNIISRKLLMIRDETFLKHWWRTALRPVAVLFVIFYLSFSRMSTLSLAGAVTLLFILADVLRMKNRSIKKALGKSNTLFKKSEKNRLSSISLFMLSIFVSLLLFTKEVAIASITFLIFGDLFAKVFGLAYGRHKLFQKSLEGSMAYLGIALVCVYVLSTSLAIPANLLLIGAIAAVVTEALPLGVGDNFTVAILSGVAMTVAQLFVFSG